MRTVLRGELLVFDLDGTLVDSKVDIVFSVNETLRRFGRPPLPDEVVAAHVGTGVRGVLLEVFDKESERIRDEVIATFEDVYWRHLCDTTVLYPGMLAVLDHYAERPKAVLTNKGTRFAVAILEKLGLSERFVGIYGKGSFPVMKPDPITLRGVCERHGVPPDRTLIIGDTTVDIRTGRAAGAYTCAVTFGYGDPESLRAEDPDAIVTKAIDLIDLGV